MALRLLGRADAEHANDLAVADPTLKDVAMSRMNAEPHTPHELEQAVWGTEPRTASLAPLTSQHCVWNGGSGKWNTRRGRPSRETKTFAIPEHESWAMRWLLQRLGRSHSAAAGLCGVAKSTWTRWLQRTSNVASMETLAPATQCAAAFPFNALHHPDVWVDKTRKPAGMAHPNTPSLLPSWLLNAPPTPVLESVSGHLDRVVVCFDISDHKRHEFKTMIRLSGKTTYSKLPFRNQFIVSLGDDWCRVHFAFAPRGNTEVIDEDTGEVLSQRSYARLDLPGRLFRTSAGIDAARWIVTQYVLPFAQPDSLELTRVDAPVDLFSDMPLSSVLLHHDLNPRAKELRGGGNVRSPHDPWLAMLVANQRHGGARRKINAYNKRSETADRLTKNPNIRALTASRFGLPLTGTAVLLHRALPALVFPPHELAPHLQGRQYIHRVEPSVCLAKGEDRHPAGFMLRVPNPFDQYATVHLGVLPHETFWRAVLYAARVEGSMRIKAEFRELGKRAAEIFDEQIRIFAAASEQFIPSPSVMFEVGREHRQRILDHVFCATTRASATMVTANVRPALSPIPAA